VVSVSRERGYDSFSLLIFLPFCLLIMIVGDSERFYYSRFDHSAGAILFLAFPRAIDSPFRDNGGAGSNAAFITSSVPLIRVIPFRAPRVLLALL